MHAPTEIRFVCVVWGETFTRYFAEFGLQTMLYPGNLPAVPALHPCSFWLYTRRSDLPTLQASPVYQRLSETLPIVIRYLEDVSGVDTETKHPHINFSLCHAAFINEGRMADAAFSFLAPDVLYADGALSGIVRRGLAGNRVVAVAAQRLNRTSVTAELTSRFMKEGILEVFPPRELIRFASNHLHEFTKVLRWGSPVGNSYPSLLWWEVGGNGHLIFVFHLQPIYIYPARPEVTLTSTIDREYLYDACPGIDPYVVSDSDEYCAYEMSHPEYLLPDQSTPPLCRAQIAHFARMEASPEQLLSARIPIRYHSEPIDDAWRAVESEALEILEDALSLLDPPVPRVSQYSPRSVAALLWVESEAELTQEALSNVAAWCTDKAEVLIARGYESDSPRSYALPPLCRMLPGTFQSMSRELAHAVLTSTDAQYFAFADRHTLVRKPHFFPLLVAALECYPQAHVAFANRIASQSSEFEMAHFVDRVLAGAETYHDPLGLMLTLGRSDLFEVPLSLSQCVMRREELERCLWDKEVGCYGSLALLLGTVVRSGAVSIPRGLLIAESKERKPSIFQPPYRGSFVDLGQILIPLDRLLSQLPEVFPSDALFRLVALLPQHIHVHALAPLAIAHQPILPTLLVAGGIHPFAEKLLRIFPENTEGYDRIKQALVYFEHVRVCLSDYSKETESIREAVARGELQTAITRLAPLLAFVTDIPDPLLLAAHVSAQLGMKAESRRYLDKLCAIAPWRIEIMLAAGKLYLELGDTRQAARILLHLFVHHNRNEEIRHALDTISHQLRSNRASLRPIPFS